MDLALEDVQRHAGKFLATIVGVGFLVGIVLTMNAMYRGNISDGIWLIEHTQADLWVVERGRGGPFNEQSRLPLRSYRSVAAVPGVASASPFISYAVQRQVGQRSQQFTVVGYDVFEGTGGPERIARGRAIARAHYELVADAKLGLAPGERVRLGPHEFEVVGITRGAVDPSGNPLAYLSILDAEDVLYQLDDEAVRAARATGAEALAARGYLPAQVERLAPLLGQDTNTINAVLVRLAPGADAAEVARHIESWLYLGVYTGAEERQLMLGGRLFRMTVMLGTFRSLLVLVSIVIMALIVYVLTMDKLKPIATLKLIGAPNAVIVRLILEQSLLLALLSFLLGYALISSTYTLFPRTMVLLRSDTLATFAVMMGGGVLASFLGIWNALRTPPNLALGG